MIVADASAGVSALLHRGSARERLAADSIHAPYLIDSEVAHAMRRAAHSGVISVSLATVAIQTWMQLGITRHSAEDLLPRIWEMRENLSAYDATYVALAEFLGCPLLTSDARLVRAPGVRCDVHVVPR